MPLNSAGSDSEINSAANISPCAWHLPGSEICVLAVDDQPANLLALEVALKDSGYKLVTAASGSEAIEKAKNLEFAAILLDIQMPYLNGFETAKIIRSQETSRHTPIIFLTALYNEEKHMKEGYDVGAVDYMYKPINVHILRAKLSFFADLFRKTKELQFHTEQIHHHEARAREKHFTEIKETTEKKYKDLVEGIRNGIVWTSDAHTRKFTFISPQVEKILGFSLAQCIDSPGFSQFHMSEEDREIFEDALKKAKHSGEGVEIEHRLLRKGGAALWFKSNIRLVPGPQGSEFRGLSVDVTNLKKTENSLREMINVRDEFLSVASHELKTPLTPLQLQVESFMKLFSEGRLKDVPEATLERMLNTSGAQVEILVKLIDQLLDVARVTSGKLQLNKTRVDLVTSLHNVAYLFDEELSELNVELKLVHPDSFMGTWDQVRIEQVIANLIHNAIKYGEGKPITVTLVQSAVDKALLAVTDSGIGIKLEDRDRIFDRYERAVSNSNFSGLGLGLYISRQLIEIHGGKIWVASEPRKYTSFYVELPIS